MLWGLAVDDAHHYDEMRLGRINPGRGWVMVRAVELTIEALIAALEEGDFYSSSGVELASIEEVEGRLKIEIVPEPGVAYTTELLGTRHAENGELGTTGEVLAVVSGPSVSYTMDGDELYVRARITSSKVKRNGYRAGEVERAWTQPVMPNRGSPDP